MKYTIKSLGSFGEGGTGVSIDVLPVPKEVRVAFQSHDANKRVAWAEIQLNPGKREWLIITLQKSNGDFAYFDFWSNRNGNKVKVWSQAGKDDVEARKFLDFADKKIKEVQKQKRKFDFLAQIHAPGTGRCYLANQSGELILFSFSVHGLSAAEVPDVRMIYECLPELVERIDKVR